MLWGCSPAGGTGALHKIVGIMRKKYEVYLLKQHLMTSSRKIKLCINGSSKWTMTPSVIGEWQVLTLI